MPTLTHYTLNFADKLEKTDQKSWMLQQNSWFLSDSTGSQPQLQVSERVELHVKPEDTFSAKGLYINQVSDFTLKELIAFQRRSDNSAES